MRNRYDHPRQLHGMQAPTDAALLDLIGHVMGLLDVDELRAGLVEALRRAVPAKYVSLTEVGPGQAVVGLEPHPGADWTHRLAALAHESPIYEHWLRTRDGRPYRLTDVATKDELHSTRLYRQAFAPLGIEFQIAFTLPHASDHMLAVELSRETHNFTETERDLLARARPFLIQAYRNAIVHARVRREPPAGLDTVLLAHGLTPREAEVLQALALVTSNRGVAQQLGISERTVQKHLEHAFRKLGVTTRAAAVSRTRELAAEDDTRRIVSPAAPAAGSGRVSVLQPMIGQVRVQREDDLVVGAGGNDR